MERGDLRRFSKYELIDLVLWLQRPEKTSRTSSKPAVTDRGNGATKPGREGNSIMRLTPGFAIDRQLLNQRTDMAHG